MKAAVVCANEDGSLFESMKYESWNSYHMW